MTERSSHHDKELIEIDSAILIGVIGSQKKIGLLLGKVASALVKANEELLGINLSIATVINGSEHSTETSDSSGSSGGHLGLNFSND